MDWQKRYNINEWIFSKTEILRRKTESAGKSKFTYNGWGIAFGRNWYWSFDGDTARKVLIFGLVIVHHLISIIQEVPFLHQAKDQVKVLIVALVQQKKISISISKAKTEFCLSLHYSGDESYLYWNKTETYKLNAKENIDWYNFSSRGVSKDFMKGEQNEISLNGNVYKFSVDHNSIKKEYFLNIHQCVMYENNTR